MAVTKDFLSVDDETSFNNRRGFQGNFLYWSVAGTKYLHMHGAIIRRHTSKGNHAAGLWLDTDNENVLIEDSRLCGNLKTGLFLEASQGPMTVLNSYIYQNGEWGIRGIASRHVLLEGNEIHDNDGFQIRIPNTQKRTHENWETGETISVSSAHWTLTDNITSGEIALIDSPDTGLFLATLFSKNNLWHNPHTFFAFKSGVENLSLQEWQELTGQDLDSIFEPGSSVGLTTDCSYIPLTLPATPIETLANGAPPIQSPPT